MSSVASALPLHRPADGLYDLALHGGDLTAVDVAAYGRQLATAVTALSASADRSAAEFATARRLLADAESLLEEYRGEVEGLTIERDQLKLARESAAMSAAAAVLSHVGTQADAPTPAPAPVVPAVSENRSPAVVVRPSVAEATERAQAAERECMRLSGDVESLRMRLREAESEIAAKNDRLIELRGATAETAFEQADRIRTLESRLAHAQISVEGMQAQLADASLRLQAEAAAKQALDAQLAAATARANKVEERAAGDAAALRAATCALLPILHALPSLALPAPEPEQSAQTLEGAVQFAVEALGSAAAAVRASEEFVSRERTELEARLVSHRLEMSSIATETDVVARKLKDTERALRRTAKELQAKTAEAETLRASADANAGARAAAEASLATLQASFAELQEAATALRSENGALKADLNALQHSMPALLDDAAALVGARTALVQAEQKILALEAAATAAQASAQASAGSASEASSHLKAMRRALAAAHTTARRAIQGRRDAAKNLGALRRAADSGRRRVAAAVAAAELLRTELESLQAAKKAAESSVRQAESKLRDAEARAQQWADKAASLEAAAEASTAKAERAERLLSKAQERRVQLEGRVAQLEARRLEEEETLGSAEDLTDRATRAEEEAVHLRRQLEGARAQLSQSQRATRAAQAEASKLQERVASLEEAAARAQEQLQQSQAAAADARSKISSAEAAVAAARAKRSAAEAETSEAQRRADAAEARADALKESYEIALAELSALSQRVRGMRSTVESAAAIQERERLAKSTQASPVRVAHAATEALPETPSAPASPAAVVRGPSAADVQTSTHTPGGQLIVHASRGTVTSPAASLLAPERHSVACLTVPVTVFETQEAEELRAQAAESAVLQLRITELSAAVQVGRASLQTLEERLAAEVAARAEVEAAQAAALPVLERTAALEDRLVALRSECEELRARAEMADQRATELQDAAAKGDQAAVTAIESGRRQLQDARRGLEEMEEKRREAQEEVMALRAELDRGLARLRQVEADAIAAHAALASTSTELTAAHAHVAERTTEAAQLRRQLADAEQRSAALLADLESMGKLLERAEAGHRADSEALLRRASQAEGELANRTRELAGATERLAELEATLKKAKEARHELKVQLKEARAQLERVTGDHEERALQAAELQLRLAQESSRSAQLEEGAAAVAARARALQGHVEDLETQLQDAAGQVQEAQLELSRGRDELARMRLEAACSGDRDEGAPHPAIASLEAWLQEALTERDTARQTAFATASELRSAERRTSQLAAQVAEVTAELHHCRGLLEGRERAIQDLTCALNEVRAQQASGATYSPSMTPASEPPSPLQYTTPQRRARDHSILEGVEGVASSWRGAVDASAGRGALLEAQLQGCLSQLHAARTELERMEGEAQAAQGEVDSLRADQAELLGRISELRAATDGEAARGAHVEGERSKALEQLGKAAAECKALRAKLDRRTKEATELARMLKAWEQMRQAKDTQIDGLLRRCRELEAQVQSMMRDEAQGIVTRVAIASGREDGAMATARDGSEAAVSKPKPFAGLVSLLEGVAANKENNGSAPTSKAPVLPVLAAEDTGAKPPGTVGKPPRSDASGRVVLKSVQMATR